MGLASVPLTGGRLQGLTELRLRGAWLLAVSVVVQVVLIVVLPHGSPGLHAGVHVASYVPAFAFVARNRRVPFLWLFGLGGLLNAVAISANGGVMPASAKALARAGITTDPSRFVNSAARAHARLAWLGDVVAVPKGWPFANVYSLGDAVLAVGAALTIHACCSARRPTPKRDETPVGGNRGFAR